MIFAHAGDTLSPSLMSSLDQGASIVTLTNMVRPDIFTPGNHEYDFGKAIFLERMAAATFPRYGANLRNADGATLPDFQDRSMVTVGGVRIGLTGATYEDSPRASDPGDLKFSSSVTTLIEQARTLRREGADFVVAVAHVTREQGTELYRSDTIDLILTGHTHDLFINYDGNTAMVESNYDAHYVTAIDVAIGVKEEDGKRLVTWWPQFRVIDTAVVTPDPEWLMSWRNTRPISAAISTPRSASPRSSSTAATRRCARARPRSARSWPTPCAGRRRPRRRSPTAAASAAARSIRPARS